MRKKLFTSSKIYIAKSRIANAGRGVFAAQSIKRDEVIEVCPVIEVPLDDVSNTPESILDNYYFYFGKNNEKLAIALGFGSIYNHAYEPNATYKKKPRDKVIDFVAIRDIKKDEEITVNYHFGNPDDKSPVSIKGVPPFKAKKKW
jgi:SET domain-containing protein